jgi:hypothetical protein
MNSSNVISLFAKKAEQSATLTQEKPEELSFMQIMMRNKANEERLKRDRQKANKGVIRSYRLKP